MRGNWLLILCLLAIHQPKAHAKTACRLFLLSAGVDPIVFYMGQRPGALDRSLVNVTAKAKSDSDPLHKVLAPIRTLSRGMGDVGRTPKFAMAQTVNNAIKELDTYRAKALSEQQAKQLAAAKATAEAEAATKAAEKIDTKFQTVTNQSPELWKEATGGQFDSMQSWQEFQSHGSFKSLKKGEITFGVSDRSAPISMFIVKDKQQEKLMLKMGNMEPVAIKWPADRNDNTSQAYLANLLEDRFLEDGELNLVKSASVTDRMNLHQFMFGVIRQNMTVSLPRGASANPIASQAFRQVESEIAASSLAPQAESAFWSARHQLTTLSNVLNSPQSTRPSISNSWGQVETEILLSNVLQSIGVIHSTVTANPN